MSAAPRTNTEKVSPGEGIEHRAVDLAMPGVAYCDPVRDWDPELIAFEQEVLERTNAVRAQGVVCEGIGQFDPAPPLVANSALNCAARVHGLYMRDSNKFSHYGPGNEGPGQRIDKTGYQTFGWAENIAWGRSSPQAVVDGWVASTGHCQNIMNPIYTQLGVGMVTGGERDPLWTQVFAVGDDMPPQTNATAPVSSMMGLMAGGLLLVGGVFRQQRRP